MLQAHGSPGSSKPLQDRLALPLGDRGIDSLALNLTVAVQAKDYTNGLVPLNRLLGMGSVWGDLGGSLGGEPRICHITCFIDLQYVPGVDDC